MKATHTCPLICHYHQCPACRFIIESRKDYDYVYGEYVKQLQCDRCEHRFLVTKFNCGKGAGNDSME